MAVVARPFSPALPHGELTEVLPDLFLVTGTVGLPGPLPVRFSRNMTVARKGDRLILVNTVRLDDAGLAALDRLGKVTDVIRLAGNHGVDDPFYADRYKAKVWALEGQRYTSGFDTKAKDTYFTPDVAIDESTALPITGAKDPPEGLLVLPLHGGTLVSGDCLQNWGATDAYFSWLGRVMMRFMGFIRAHNVGPAWFKQAKPPREELRAITDLPFANLLPGHGAPVLGNAAERYRPAIDRVTS
jgi:hypothetical protein